MMHRISSLVPQVVSAGWAEFAPDEAVPPHQHPTWELVYVLEGRVCCPMGDDVFHVCAGDMLLTPPHTVHYEMGKTAWSCLYVGIDVPAEQPWPRLYRDDAQRSLDGLCSMLVREWDSREPDRDAMLELLVRQLDILLRRSFVQERLTPAERLVREAEQRIERGFARPLTIKQLARELGVSHSYLRARFLSLRGRSAMAYLQMLRVQRALALTATSDLSLEAIAGRCGYNSASHLSRAVKQATGKRPGAFRRETTAAESTLRAQTRTADERR